MKTYLLTDGVRQRLGTHLPARDLDEARASLRSIDRPIKLSSFGCTMTSMIAISRCAPTSTAKSFLQ